MSKKNLKTSDFKEALKLAFSNIKTLLGGGFVLLPLGIVGIFTNFVGHGYIIKCGTNAKLGSDKLPLWKPIGGLWADYFVASLLSVPYFLVPLLILFIAGNSISGDFLFLGDLKKLSGFLLDPFTYIFSGTLDWEVVLICLLFLPSIFILPIVYINWFSTRETSACFEQKKIWGVALRKDYFIVWFIYIVVSFAFVFLVQSFSHMLDGLSDLIIGSKYIILFPIYLVLFGLQVFLNILFGKVMRNAKQ